jgi:hypothetical protein
MTQDQYGQDRGSGYVARGDVDPDDTTEGYPSEQATAKTRFQKVASALLGDKADRDEEDLDEPTANRATTSREVATGSDATAQGRPAQAANPPWVTEQDEAAMANSPISRKAQGTGAPPPDYWDESDATEDERVAATRPDAPPTASAARRGETPGQAGPDFVDHQATDPDMAGQRGAATIADVPAARTPSAGTPAAGGMRPGEATAALGDFSDLTYGNLVPDAEQYAAQWQQIQFRFVDDPHASVTEAADVVAQVTAKMEAAIQERQRAIEERQHAIAEQQRSLRDRWGEGTNADTEAMRETLRMYKTFLDQLIGSRAS